MGMAVDTVTLPVAVNGPMLAVMMDAIAEFSSIAAAAANIRSFTKSIQFSLVY